MVGNHKPQSQSSVDALGGAVRLPKVIEDIGQGLRVDAFASIGDRDLDEGVDPLELDFDVSALCCELNSIGEQVPDDLLQAIGVTCDLPGVGIEPEIEVDTFGLYRRRHAVNHRVDDRDEVHGLDLKLHLTALDTRDIEEVMDQLGLEPHVALDGRGSLSGHLGIYLAAGEHVRPT